MKIAKNRHDLVLKALNSSNDYVLAFGSNLELNANYHLTCGQNDDQYLTQILSKDGRVSDFSLNNLEKSTEYISELIGASYIVFSGALKSEPGLNCKFSIVEDGVLVQLLPNLLEKLKNSLKQKTDFNLNCIQNSTSEVDEVQVVWTDDDLNFNLGLVFTLAMLFAKESFPKSLWTHKWSIGVLLIATLSILGSQARSTVAAWRACRASESTTDRTASESAI